MGAREITLDAALRDVASTTPDIRNVAVRNLAVELLAERDVQPPHWRAAEDHPRGREVLDALHRAAADEALPAIRGLAFMGLGQLGEPSVVDDAADWLAIDGGEEGEVFLRECAIIALSFVGSAAPDSTEGARVRGRVLEQLRALLHSPRAEVRFQATMAIAEVGDASAEPELVAALEREDDPNVRENLVVALSTFDPPGAPTLDALEQLVSGEDGAGAAGFEAALVLAGARRVVAGGRLASALHVRDHRDRALEGLAALGSLSPRAAIDHTRRLATSWLTPAITRVRAAYALARMVPGEGLPLLDKMARSFKPAVREAVDDARRGLDELARRDP